jgi:hypothetical protein
MAAQVLTFEDVRIAVVTALKGVGIANVAVGQATMDNAINKAMIRVVSEAPIPEYAASLYTVAPLTVTAGVASHPTDVLVPLAVEVSGGKTIRKPLMETLRVELTNLPGTNEYCYSFAGMKTVIRPQVAQANLHYLAVPPALSGPTDPFPLSPALFNVVVLAASLTASEKMANVDPQQVARIVGQYDAAIGYLNGNTNKELLAAWLTQSARSSIAGAGGGVQQGD